MALTNYVIGTTAHPGGTWTIEDTDTATVGRYRELAFLMEGATGASQLTQARPGVLTAGTLDNTTNTPNALALTTASSGLDLNIARGAAVVERDTKDGSYTVVSYSPGKVTLGTADATNYRVDRIDLQVLDGAVGDNSGTSQTAFVVTPGTPASMSLAVAAAAPINSIPIGTVKMPPLTTTITGTMVADTRKSTALRGSIRVLLPGDSLADPGFHVGEMRNTIVVSNTPTIDWWSTTGSAWVRMFELSPPGEKYNAPSGGITGITSTSYVDAVPVSGGVCGVTFVAPASGIVGIDWGASLRSSALTLQAVMSPQVRAGGTLGSGSVVMASADTQSVKSNAQTTTTTVSGFHELTGLTAGSTYNVVLQWKVSSAGSGNGDSPRVRVTPRPN